MKTAYVRWVLGIVALLVTGGCISNPATQKRFTYAITVTVQGQQPTAAQRDAAIALYVETMQPRGWVLVRQGVSANEIVHLNFVPDPTDPQHKGQVAVLGVTRHVIRRPETYASTGYRYRSRFNDSPYRQPDYYSGPSDAYSTDPDDDGTGNTRPPRQDGKPPHQGGNPPDQTGKPLPPSPMPPYHKPNLREPTPRRWLPENDAASSTSSPSASDSSQSSGSGASYSSSSSSSSASDSGSSFSPSSANDTSSSSESVGSAQHDGGTPRTSAY